MIIRSRSRLKSLLNILLRRVHATGFADAPRDLRALPVMGVGTAYDLWADTYSPDAHNALMALEQTALLSLMPALAGQRVLDLACGTGRYSRIAEQAGAASVVGADSSLAMLRRMLALRSLTPGPSPSNWARGENALEVPRPPAGEGFRVRDSPPPIHILQASMDILTFPSASFDVVICALATGHLPPTAMRRAILEMARVLRPGGEALISDFHPALYALGGRRTLSSPDGQLYAVEHYPHALDDYREALAAAGLRVVALAEPQADFQGRKVEAVLVLRCQRDS